MHRSRGSLFAFALLAACAPSPTQLVVVVDTDLRIPLELDEVRITVTGPEGVMETETGRVASPAGLPLTVAVVADTDDLGPIEVVAEGRRGGAFVVDRRATATLVRGETRVLSLFLLASCVGVDCGSEALSCGEEGCRPRDVGEPPPWTGRPPRLDAGRVDGGPADAGPFDGGSFDGGRFDAPTDAPPRPCDVDADCEDGLACTTDRCTASGCDYTANDAMCTDENDCTDDRCVVGVGCMPVPNSLPCSDGTFCNGFDTCSGGTCSAHAGNPCSGSTVCDEAGGRCTGCTSDADCPMRSVGAFGACDYADGCDEGASRSRTVRTYTCSSGACVPTDGSESEPCARDTDGMGCGVGSCGSFGTCDYSDGCDESAVMTRTCNDLVCMAGTCRSTNRNETAPCSRDTDGMGCGAPSCGGYGPCDYADTCDESANQSRTCNDFSCGGGSCNGTPRSESIACTRDTDGTSCGAGAVCSAASCIACSRNPTGAFGVPGMSDFIRTDGAGSSLTFVDYAGTSGSITVPGVTFSGSVSTPIALWQVHGLGNAIRLVDWDGATMGIINVSGANVTGTWAPPCVDSGFGCFPPYVQRVVGVPGGLQILDSTGGMGTISFACP